jgi:hypothetical protein
VLVERALAAVDAVCEAVPSLRAESATLRTAIDAVADTWRRL